MDGAVVCAGGQAGDVLQPEGRQAPPRYSRAQRGQQTEEDSDEGARLSCRVRQAGQWPIKVDCDLASLDWLEFSV